MSRQFLKKDIEKLSVSGQLGILQEEGAGLALAAREVFGIRYEDTIEHIAEEMASISILMEQMILIFPNISGKVSKYKSDKLQKLEMRANLDSFESPHSDPNHGTQLEIQFPD